MVAICVKCALYDERKDLAGPFVLASSVSLPQVVHDPPRYSADNALVKGLLTAMHHPSRLFPSRNGRRLRWRYEHDGFDGLFDHRHRTPSPRRAPVAEVQRVVRLYAERYHGFNVRHFHQIVRREHGVMLSYSFVKKALQAAHLVSKRRARGRHRRRREPRPCFGELVHLDGRRHP